MQNKDLYQVAKAAQANAHAPYSNFRVGAALLTKSGKVYTGCNVENSSYSLAVCAERTAIFKAVSEGEREFERILIVADSEDYCPPCGACRQVLSDLAGNIDVVLTNSQGDEKTVKLNELLPMAFTTNFLKKR